MRALALVAAAVAAVVLFVALRPGDDGADQAAPPATAATTTVRTAPAPAPAAKPTTKAKAKAPAPIRIAVRGGRVAGGIARPTARKGQTVTLVVRADTHDHVHVHGYDLMRDVAPGKLARLSFRATVAGRFEIELEDAGLQIAELEVRP